MAYTSKLKSSIEQLTKINLNGVDYIVKSDVESLVDTTEEEIANEVKLHSTILTNTVSVTNTDEAISVNCDDHENFIRSHTEPKYIVIACIIPFVIHFALCLITQLTNLNFEGITGGVVRSVTGSFAVLGLLALAIFILTKYVMRIFYVRYTVSSCENYPVYDGITDYKQLTSWQRLKFDLLFIFGLSLLFSLLFTAQLLGFLQIPTTNLNP